MNKASKVAVTSAVAAGLVFGLAGCKDTPPDDFKKACDSAGGKTMRENDFESLGMAPMAFVAGSGKGGSKSSGKKSGGFGSIFGGGKSKPKSKSPKTTNKNNGWKLAGGNGHTKPKKSKKSKSHDDNEWVCAKNGVEIFDED